MAFSPDTGLGDKTLVNLLATNFVPSEFEVLSIKSSIEQEEFNIKEVDSLIATTKQQLKNLQKQRSDSINLLAVKQGLIAPVRKIPSEVMEQIMDEYVHPSWTLPTDASEKCGIPRPDVKLRCLSRVCKQWRCLVLNNPKLWTLISLVNGLPLQAILAFLRRSHSLPLNIYVDSDWRSYGKGDEEMEDGGALWPSILRELSENMYRCRLFHCEAALFVLEGLFPSTKSPTILPALESLRIGQYIVFLHHDDYSKLGDIIAPNIRDLQITHAPLALHFLHPDTSFGNLKHASILVGREQENEVMRLLKQLREATVESFGITIQPGAMTQDMAIELRDLLALKGSSLRSLRLKLNNSAGDVLYPILGSLNLLESLLLTRSSLDTSLLTALTPASGEDTFFWTLPQLSYFCMANPILSEAAFDQLLRMIEIRCAPSEQCFRANLTFTQAVQLSESRISALVNLSQRFEGFTCEIHRRAQ